MFGSDYNIPMLIIKLGGLGSYPCSTGLHINV